MKSQILHPITEEVIMEVHHNIYSIEQLSQAIDNSGLQIKHSGNLELNQRDDELRYPFEMISQEISKDITMGYFFHIRKPE